MGGGAVLKVKVCSAVNENVRMFVVFVFKINNFIPQSK